MKVSTGSLKYKNVYSIKKNGLRPTSLKVRQAIFNILIHRFDWREWAYNSVIFEPFAGTGIISVESISRGIFKASLIEKDRDVFLNLKRNIENLNLCKQVNLFNQDFLSFNNKEKAYKLIFLDPPYKDNILNLSIEKIYDEKIACKKSIIVCESQKNYRYNNTLYGSKVLSKIYGKSEITFFKR